MDAAELTFGWEPCRKLFDDPSTPDLLKSHWHELAVHKAQMLLDPDFGRFVELEDLGLFRVWAARSGPTLVGYIGWFIQPHLHYKSTLTATEDLFLLSAPYRRGMNGVRMFLSSFEALKELGVKRIIAHTKVHFESERGGLDKLFGRLGFVVTDSLWSRML